MYALKASGVPTTGVSRRTDEQWSAPPQRSDYRQDNKCDRMREHIQLIGVQVTDPVSHNR
jgi:hypothetical protein